MLAPTLQVALVLGGFGWQALLASLSRQGWIIPRPRPAFGHGAGIWLPHSTYAMLGSRHLHRISLSQARRGDLMFYGSGHVEINTIWYHQTFGAHHSGERVGWRKWSPYWYPTAAYRVW